MQPVDVFLRNLRNLWFLLSKAEKLHQEIAVSDHDAMLQEAIAAIEQGEQGKARRILTRLLRVAPEEVTYWLWMSAAVETEHERRYCLQRAYALAPDDPRVRQGMVLLGQQPVAAEDVAPAPPAQPYAWEPPRLREHSRAGLPKRVPAKALWAALIVALLGMLAWGGRALWQQAHPPSLPTPPLRIYATSTPTPSPTPVAQALDALQKGTPLAVLVPATATPTPPPFSTPHRTEDFRLGLRALQQHRWEQAIARLKSAAKMPGEPQADIAFYLGEAYRHLGRWDEAAAAYQQALQAEPEFAPAMVGLAQVALAQDDAAQALRWAKQALQTDPHSGWGYIVRAQARLQAAPPNAQAALADLRQAETLLPDSPWVPLVRAQALLALGQPEKAYEQAQMAWRRDPTLVPVYKVLGQSALRSGRSQEAARYLRVYLLYAPDDTEAQHLLERARGATTGTPTPSPTASATATPSPQP